MWYSAIRPLLFALDPERAHHLVFKSMQYAFPARLQSCYLASLPMQPITVSGLTFPNPVGLAAGLDKDGQYMHLLHSFGFGFIEVGTVTPRPQLGNSKPRLFRIPSAHALINRMGFNNQGVDALVKQLQARPRNCIIGANLGKNKDTPLERAADDYCIGLARVYPHVDYVTINISSPNTPGLRTLQSEEYLAALLSAICESREQLRAHYQHYLPIWLKIAPDITEDELHSITTLLLQYQLDGIVATNTTTDHHAVAHYSHGNEAGGVSGAPLYECSTEVVRRLHAILQGRIPIIAVGGILSAEQALAKLQAGASLLQLYTGLIYKGPGLVKDILQHLHQ